MKNKILIITIIVILLLGLTSSIFAIPPHPDLVEKYRSEGRLDELTEKLEEMKAIGMNKPYYKADGRSNLQAVPTKGINNVLVIRVGFSNVGFNSVSTNTFYENLFVNGPNNDGFGWKQFYLDMSNGELELNFDVVYAGNAPNTHSHYGTGYTYVRDLVVWAINQVDPTVDFSNYDNDGDGYVDGVVLIHAEPGEETSGVDGHIWSHRWSLTFPMTVDGVSVYDYSMQPEYKYSPGDSTIGVFAHEFGHLLGLPDLYDTSYNTKGVGKWSLMSGGSWNGPSGSSGARPAPLLAWEKDLLGWISINGINPKDSNTLISSIDNNETDIETETMENNPDNRINLSLIGLISISFIFLIIGLVLKKGKMAFLPIIIFFLIVLTPVSIIIYSCQPPITLPTPANVSASDGTHINLINVTWDIVPDASGYEIYLSETESGKYSQVENLIYNNENSVNISGLEHDNTYWFKVRAIDEEGVSEFSEPNTGFLGDIKNNAIQIYNNEWQESDLLKSEEKWFYFNATSGTEYYIYWDDKNQGSSYYTIDVEVTAYHSDLTATYFENKDDGYTNPISINTQANEPVYIKVSGVSWQTLGSFAIKYNQTGEANGSFSLMEVEESDEAVKVVLGDSGSQYYLIENKVLTPDTWAEFLPAGGLLICHIDDDFADSYEINSNSVNTRSVHGVSVKEADGDNNLWDGFGSSQGDTYDSPETLTPYTNPNTNLNSNTTQNGGSSSGISITNISSAGRVMSFDVTKD